MEVEYSPSAIDEPNLLYKIQNKVKVVGPTDLPNRGYNLIATSSKYGLVFVGFPKGSLSVYYLKDLCSNERENPLHVSISLTAGPTHISVSCDGELLVVTNGQFLSIYRVIQFQEQNVLPATTIPGYMSAPEISSLQWNPCIPDMIAIAYYDGTLLAASVLTNQVKILPAKARCICWSPKGKQVVVGNNDGTLCQYKPDLSVMKTVPAPKLFNGSPMECLAIHWISTFQFAVVYKNTIDNERPAVTIVNTPKGGQPSCINYDDLCYSMGSTRPWYYYLLGIPQWNMILTSSSNSIEIATLGSVQDNSWVQWFPADEARPELPLSGKDDNFPVGIAIDNSALYQIPWGENNSMSLPHMPLLLVMSHTGLLVIFNVINLNNNASQFCTSPQPIALPTAVMTSAIPGDEKKEPVPAKPLVQPLIPQVPTITQAPTPSFGLTSTESPNANLPENTSKPQVNISSFLPRSPVVATPPAPPQILNIPTPLSQPSFAPLTPKQPAEPLQPTPEQNAQKIKEDKERAAVKANRELTSMILKEVNDFQMELHNFMKTSHSTQVKLAETVNKSEPSYDLSSLNTEGLKQDCCLDELRSAIIQLKLELVRACAVVAEARTYDESKELQQLSQPDPLTTKKITSINNRIYHVETQLDQAQKALDYKWNQLAMNDYNDKRTPRMIRPILDDVYYPLVKQQEILSRQKAVLKSLKNTLKQCDTLPWKTSLLRSTPFKKDPLSKLTKNLLNMSIDPNTDKNVVVGLSTQKLDALRDMLANHKTVRIKPVNVEMRQHYATLRSKYEKTLKDKVVKEKLKVVKQTYQPATRSAFVETSNVSRSDAGVATSPFEAEISKILGSRPTPQMPLERKLEENRPEVKPDVSKFVTPAIPSKTAPPNIASVTRTLFTDVEKPVLSIPKPVPSSAASSPAQAPVLKDHLQKTTVEPKSSTNSFLGMSICSPTAKAPTSKPFGGVFAPTSTNVFAASSSASNIWSISSPFASKSQSAETGEAEAEAKDEKKTETVIVPIKKAEPKKEVQTEVEQAKVASKPIALYSTEKVPDLSKITPKAEISVKNETSAPVSIQKVEAQTTEADIAPTSTAASVVQIGSNQTVTSTTDSSKASLFPASTATSTSSSGSIFGSLLASKPSSIFGTNTTTTQVTSMLTSEVTISYASKPNEDSAKSVFGSASSAPSVFSAPATPPTEVKAVTVTSTDVSPTVNNTVTTSAGIAPVFGATVSSSPASIFASATTTQSSIFGSPTASNASIFSTAAETVTSVFGSSTSTTQPSVFSSPTITTQNTVFGTPAVTQSSVFGSTTSTPSLFGSPSPAASVFASATQAAQPTGFGTPPPSTQTSIFGSPAAANQGSIFGGTPPVTTQSIFGSPTTATQSSVFGSPNAATQQASPFGGAESNLFASASISTTTPSGTNAGNIFGSSNNTSGGSLFSGGSVFGSSGSAFGQKPAASIFGGSTTFGQNTTTNLWGATTTSASGFGSSFSKPSQAQSVFGSATGGSFSATVPAGQAFTNPTQNTSPFGSPQQQPASGFGGGAVFGSKPVFGQSAGFGGGGFGSFGNFNKSPTSGFGGAATFGGSAFGSTSPSSVFGSSSPPSGIGQPAQSNAFETLASQNTIGFGNLAQQSPQQPAPAQPFNTSPSFTGWRG